MSKIKKLLSTALAAGMIASSTMSLFATNVYALSNGLGITPRKDYTISPGQSRQDTLYLDDLSTTQDLSVQLKVIDFSASGENGTPALHLNNNAPQTPWSLKPYIKVPSSVTVPAGKSKNIPFSINIPSGLGAGSYYSAIEYVATGVGTQKNVSVAASGATLIFVTVPGKTTELMNLVKFGAFTPSADDSTGSFSSWYFTSPPKVLAYVLENKGNVAEQPSGTIILDNFSGKQVATIKQANPKDSLALRGQTRRFETCINPTTQTVTGAGGQQATQTVCASPKLSPGRYTAKIYAYYGTNGNPTQQIVATATFWYLPWWFLVIAVVVIALIALAIYLIIHKIRHHAGRMLRR